MQSYTKWLRWGLVGGLLLVPFISFLIADGSLVPVLFFPYITAKGFAFRLLVELLLLAYIILAIREPKYRPKASLIMWTVGAFVLWMGVALIFSVDPIKSFWSNFERMDGYISILHLYALFLVSGAMLAADRAWDWLFRISIGIGAWQGIWAILQFFDLFGFSPSSQSGGRADTSFGNATYLAVFLLFTIFLTLLMMVRDQRSKMLLWAYGAALALEGAGLFFTETRGAILGVVGGLMIGALYIVIGARGGQWKTLRMGALGILGVIALFGVLFFAFKDTSFVRQLPGVGRLASISLHDTTTEARLFYIWPMAVQGALEKPVTGWGQENFNFIFNAHYDPTQYAQEQWFDRAHNQFLDWFVAGGAPALLLYAALFVLAALAILRSGELAAPEQAILLGLLAAYAFNNLFVFDNLLSAVFFWFLLAYLHSLSWKPLPGWMFLSKPASDRTVAVVAPLVVVAVAAGMWYFNAQGIARAQTIIDALQQNSKATGTTMTVAEHQALFDKAFSQGELGKQEVMEQMFQFGFNTVAPATGIDPQTKQEYYNDALAAGTQMLAERKNDARLEYFMSSFLAAFGNYDEALAHIQTALQLSPDKQELLFREGMLYFQKGDSAKGLAVLKKAYELAPAYDAARIYYAAGLNYAGQTAQADALLKDRFGTVLVDDQLLIQAYSLTKQYDRVIGIWKNRLEASPQDVQISFGLANAYLVAGQQANAIAVLQKVAAANPAAAAQIQTIVAQIKAGTIVGQ